MLIFFKAKGLRSIYMVYTSFFVCTADFARWAVIVMLLMFLCRNSCNSQLRVIIIFASH